MSRTFSENPLWAPRREGYLPIPNTVVRGNRSPPSLKNVLSAPGSRISIRKAAVCLLCLGIFGVVYSHRMSGWASGILKSNDATCLRSESDEDGLEPGELFQFSDLHTPSNNFYIPYRDTNTSPTRHQPTYNLEATSNCLDDHIALGAICPTEERDLRLDLVWAYVNGTDPLHEKAYRQVRNDLKYQNPKTFYPSPKAGSFREFDELRYSVRSVARNFRHAARQLFVLTSSFPLPGCDSDAQQSTAWRLGQIPQWLRQQKEAIQTKTWIDGSLQLNLLHHHDIFEPLHNQSIFNSLAIESRLHLIEGLSSNLFVPLSYNVRF